MLSIRNYTGTVYICNTCGQPCGDTIDMGICHFSEQWDGVLCPYFPLSGTPIKIKWDGLSLKTLKAKYPDTYPH
jgi:hypothetical protein